MLTVLVTSPRVAPGAYSRAAWAALERAQVVLADVVDDHARAVQEVGIEVRATEPDPETVAALALTQDVVLLTAEAQDPVLRAAAVAEVVRAGGPDPVEMPVAPELPGAHLLDAVAVMDALRTGCPWDREQTHASLAKYLVEEAYETLEAIDSGDPAHLREELGDVLLQVLFHARVAQDGPEPFDIDDVAAGFVEKMVRRHPHVFAGVQAADAAAVEARWEMLKAQEKAERTHVLDGVPPMPPLERAEKVVSRLTRAGRLDAAETLAAEAGPDDLGAALLALVLRARAEGEDPSAALRATLARLRERV